MRKKKHKQKPRRKKHKPTEPQIAIGDDGCWELPPKKKRRGKSR